MADFPFSSSIDKETFEQILEMDDDGTHEFSQSIVFGFFEQAETTFERMQEGLKKKDLSGLSALGHFLKGSSATLGLVRIRDGCEKIQHYGAHKDDHGEDSDDSDDQLISKIDKELVEVTAEYERCEVVLKNFYKTDS